MKISKATKILWTGVLSYVAVMLFMVMINVDSPLPELMAEMIGVVLFGALALQFIIFTINKFIIGYKDDSSN